MGEDNTSRLLLLVLRITQLRLVLFIHHHRASLLVLGTDEAMPLHTCCCRNTIPNCNHPWTGLVPPLLPRIHFVGSTGIGKPTASAFVGTRIHNYYTLGLVLLAIPPSESCLLELMVSQPPLRLLLKHHFLVDNCLDGYWYHHCYLAVVSTGISMGEVPLRLLSLAGSHNYLSGLVLYIHHRAKSCYWNR